MEIGKLNLYLDNEEVQRFQEKGISQDEMKMVEHGFLVEKRIRLGNALNKTNPENLPYIILLKKRNNLRSGNPNIFDRTIYYEIKDKKLAKKKLLYAFKQITIGRDENSIQNLGFITKQNLEFVSSLTKEKASKKLVNKLTDLNVLVDEPKKEKEGKDNDKKGNYRNNN